MVCLVVGSPYAVVEGGGGVLLYDVDDVELDDGRSNNEA
jgi:hypothetical protein